MIFLAIDFQRVWINSVRRGEMVYSARVEVDNMIRKLICDAVNCSFPCNEQGLELFKIQIFLIYQHMSNAINAEDHVDFVDFDDDNYHEYCVDDEEDDE